MEITLVPEEDEKLADLLQAGWDRRQTSPRAPGFHVSGLITDIGVTSGMFPDYGPPGKFDPMSVLRMTMGFIWEDIIGDYLSVMSCPISQIPLELDGIHGTVDGLTVDGVLEEYKATWKSEHKAINDGWRWFEQMRAYARMLGTLDAKLRVLHVCPIPRSRTYRITFTPREVHETWYMLSQHKNHRVAQGLNS